MSFGSLVCFFPLLFGVSCVCVWGGLIRTLYVGKMFGFYHVEMLLHVARHKLNCVSLK